jgi:endoglucanase
LAAVLGLALCLLAPTAAADINSNVTPLQVGQALAADPSTVVSGSFVAAPPDNGPNAVSTTPISGFPTVGSQYADLTSGSAALAEDPPGSHPDGFDDGGGNVRGNTDYDVTILKVDVNVPSGDNCLIGFDFKFLSEEYPTYVGTAYNDAFIAELDHSTWTTSGSQITAPNNFAFDPEGNPISINASGPASMSAANAAGTPYGGATPTLTASTPITPGPHSIYFSIFDQGDHILDSAVFIDNLSFGHVADPATDCVPGAKQAAQSYYSTLVKGDGAIAYWPLDETGSATVAQDVVGSHDGNFNSNGVKIGRVGRGPGDTGYALDGSSGSIKILASSDLNRSSLSVEGWLRIDPKDANHFDYLVKDGDAGQDGYGLGVFGGVAEGQVCLGPNNCVTVASKDGSLADGNWHQLALTKDAGTVTLYVDGLVAGSAAAAGPIYYPLPSTLTIGSWPAAGDYFKGGIDDLSIYPSPLSAQQVGAHFAAGACPQAPSSDLLDSAAPPPAPVLDLPALPLHTNGRWITDNNGATIKLAGVNWYGAESTDHAPSGLQCQPLSSIVHAIAERGFNVVRLPWATDTWTGDGRPSVDPPVPPIAVAANPQLRGLGAHEVFDAVIAELARQHLMVILDNHVARSDWCCSRTDGNGLWWTGYDPNSGSFAQKWNSASNGGKHLLYTQGRLAWESAWRNIVRRYAQVGSSHYRAAVVGAELRNEPRPDDNLHLAAVWGGSGTPEWEDWPKAATQAGSQILSQNPELLIVVDGVDFSTRLGGQDDDTWNSIKQTPDLGSGLRGVAGDPIPLPQLVYSAHDYSFTHFGAHYNDGCVDGGYAIFQACLGNNWGFVLDQTKSYVAPLWVSEFGTCDAQETTGNCTAPTLGTGSAGAQGRWFGFLTDYLQQADIPWAYWALNGTSAHEAQSQGDCTPAGNGCPSWPEGTAPRFLGISEGYGILDPSWRTDASSSLTAALQALQ